MTTIHTIHQQLTQCSVDGCEKPKAQRYLMCHTHRNRRQRYGDVHYIAPVGGPRMDPSRRFWSKVDVRGPDECWIFNGTVLSNGYGQFRIDTETRIGAHRYAWLDTNGAIPGRLTIDHLCCVPRCVNPAHMELVSGPENVRRRWEREKGLRP